MSELEIKDPSWLPIILAVLAMLLVLGWAVWPELSWPAERAIGTEVPLKSAKACKDAGFQWVKGKCVRT